MKKALMLISLLSLAGAASLPFPIILEGGIVIGKASTNSTDVDEKWSAGGFEIGAKISYNYPDTKFYIERGIYYTYVEGKFEDTTSKKEEKFGLHFLKLPIEFAYEVYKNNDVSFKAGLGPYFAYRLDGNDTLYEDWDLGLIFGGSLTYMDKIVVDARFDLGLKDIRKDNVEVKSRAFVIDVGYKFNF